VKIRIIESCAGMHDGQTFAFVPGDVVTVPDELGKDLTGAGYAEKDSGKAPRAEKRVRAPKETRG